MDNITVHDNFLTIDELTKSYEIINNGKWLFGHKSTTEIDKNQINVPFWSMDLKEEKFFSEYLKNIIEKHLSKKFILDRVYANGQTFGQDGSYHIDSNKENSYTFCLYLHEKNFQYNETVAGHFYIKIPNEKYILCFEPLINRGIYFPSNYIHKGSAFSRYVVNMRIVVTWKFTEIID